MPSIIFFLFFLEPLVKRNNKSELNRRCIHAYKSTDLPRKRFKAEAQLFRLLSRLLTGIVFSFVLCKSTFGKRAPLFIQVFRYKRNFFFFYLVIFSCLEIRWNVDSSSDYRYIAVLSIIDPTRIKKTYKKDKLKSYRRYRVDVCKAEKWIIFIE